MTVLIFFLIIIWLWDILIPSFPAPSISRFLIMYALHEYILVKYSNNSSPLCLRTLYSLQSVFIIILSSDFSKEILITFFFWQWKNLEDRDGGICPCSRRSMSQSRIIHLFSSLSRSMQTAWRLRAPGGPPRWWDTAKGHGLPEGVPSQWRLSG